MMRSRPVRGSGMRGAAAMLAVPLAIGIAVAASARSSAPAPSVPPPLPATAALPTPAEPIALAGMLRPGLWEVRSSDGGDAVQRLCIGDPALLIQLRHHRTGCGRFVIANSADTATVQYSCPGAGWGRTTLRATGAENLRIDTQGIAENAPFAFSAIARRTGDCGAAASVATH